MKHLWISIFLVLLVACGYGTDETPEPIVNAPDSGGDEIEPATGEVKQMIMTAKQWEFIPNKIEVNQGDTVKLQIRSIDVAHGFAIPEFGINERLVPGSITTVEFVANKKGTFDFICSVVCGAGHSGMNGILVVN